MISPLTKRLPRELLGNIGKYLGIFLMMVLSISFGSGYMIAQKSILSMLDTSYEDYNIEDAELTAHYQLPNSVINDIESTDPDDEDKLTCKVYENFYLTQSAVLNNSQEPSADNATGKADIRFYKPRDVFNKSVLCEGKQPQSANEIAVDRTFATNNGLTVGDTIEMGGKTLTVSGIIVLSDYQALFDDNSSFIFNSITFGVGVVSEECFAAFEDAGASLTYNYAILFDDRGLSQTDRVSQEWRISRILNDADISYEELLDSSSVQSIGYALDDLQGDGVMWEVLVILLVVIMAFVFVVLNNANIEQESAAIGTMLSLGYTKGELLRHYMALPFVIGLLSVIVGVALGMGAFGSVMQGLYYHSYSLPPYVYSFHFSAYLLSAILPFVLLVGISYWGLARKMNLKPLEFLRHETSKTSERRMVALPEKLSFTNRFRLRVFLRGLPNFITLFVGILFASLLLLFGLCMLPTIEHYADNMRNDMVCQYQYNLNKPVELDGTKAERTAAKAQHELDITDPADLSAARKAKLEKKAKLIDEDDETAINSQKNTKQAIAQAEKVAISSLSCEHSIGGGEEEVTVYGIQKNSAYWTDFELDDDTVLVSQGVKEKCGAKVGKMLTLTNEYTGWSYDVSPTEIVGGASSINIYMSIDHFNDLFGNDADYFNAYASNEELNIDSWLVSNTLTPASMDAIADQMENSMGDLMGMIAGVAAAVYLILMYLLTKTIIEHSARYISYMKVFGYRNREVNKFYLTAITITVVVSLLISIPIIIGLIFVILKLAMMSYAGNISAYYPPVTLLEIIGVGLVAYALVALLHVRRIRRVPLTLALKVQE